VVAEVQGVGLFVRDLSRASVRFVEGTEGDATTPVISPDGQWIAYVDQVSDELRRVPLAGGRPTTIMKNAAGSFGMTWGPDDSIVYADLALGLRRVPIAGGTPEVLTEVNHAAQEGAHWLPELLPRVLFTVMRTPLEKTSIEVLDHSEQPSRPRLLRGHDVSAAPQGLFEPSEHIRHAVGSCRMTWHPSIACRASAGETQLGGSTGWAAVSARLGRPTTVTCP
jgi:hypothetical protein